MTKIEWCDKTENFNRRGCSHGCSYCYAEKFSKRLICMECARWLKKEGVELEQYTPKERVEIYKNTPVWCQDCWDFKPHIHNKSKEVKLPKEPKRIFIDSMWDWCCKDNPKEMTEGILDIVRAHPQHTFQILTKRPGRYNDYTFPINAWLGTTVTSQDDVGRIMQLKAFTGGYMPPRIKFVSVEPIKGVIEPKYLKGLDWVIVGAETGNGKSKVIQTEKKYQNVPVSPTYVNIIVHACEDFGIPLFLKDNLNWPTRIQQFPKKSKGVWKL